MQNLFLVLFVVLAVVAGVCAFSLLSLPYAIAAAVALAVLVWLVFTWYHADDEPVFGAASSRRVTFKEVLAAAITDARELLDRFTNMVGVMVVSLDGVIASTPELKEAVLQSSWGLPVILALNLFAAMTPRRATA